MRNWRTPLLILLGLLLAAGWAWWLPESAPPLVAEVLPVRAKERLPEAPVAKRYRHVRLNPDTVAAVQTGGRSITLELFPGESIQVLLEKAASTGTLSTEVHGEVVGMPGAAVSLITYEGVLAGSIEFPDGRHFLINYADEEAHSIVEIDSMAVHAPQRGVPLDAYPETLSLFQPREGGVVSMPQFRYRPGVLNRVPGFPQFAHVLTLTNTLSTNLWPVPVTPVMGPPIVGVLACYTGLAEKQCGGKRGVETRVRISVAQVNNAFRRSAVTARLVLLGTEKVSHVTSGNSTKDLVDMTFATTPGSMKIHEQRQRYRADLVSLFTGASPQNILHGSSWMLNSTNGAPGYGFNVVEAIYAPTSVFVHEIGHNLGCSHARDDIGGSFNGVYTNSHGWKFNYVTNTYSYPMRTVMAYGAGRRLGYFSNPTIKHWGVATGDTNFANNAFTIQQMAPVVGAYFTEIIHHTQLVPNAQPILILPGTTNRPGARQPRRIFWGTGE